MTSCFVDYYSLLGVAPTATREQIHAAFRRAALQHHPDKLPAEKSAEANEAFIPYRDAKEFLTQTDVRLCYDQVYAKYLLWQQALENLRRGLPLRPIQTPTNAKAPDHAKMPSHTKAPNPPFGKPPPAQMPRTNQPRPAPKAAPMPRTNQPRPVPKATQTPRTNESKPPKPTQMPRTPQSKPSQNANAKTTNPANKPDTHRASDVRKWRQSQTSSTSRSPGAQMPKTQKTGLPSKTPAAKTPPRPKPSPAQTPRPSQPGRTTQPPQRPRPCPANKPNVPGPATNSPRRESSSRASRPPRFSPKSTQKADPGEAKQSCFEPKAKLQGEPQDTECLRNELASLLKDAANDILFQYMVLSTIVEYIESCNVPDQSF